MKFILFVNVNMPTIVRILTFISKINTTSEFKQETRPNSAVDLNLENTDCILTYLLGETMSKFNIEKNMRKQIAKLHKIKRYTSSICQKSVCNV